MIVGIDQARSNVIASGNLIDTASPCSPPLSGGESPNSFSSHFSPVPAGVIRLVFLVGWARDSERYLIGFRVGDYPDGIALEVTDREIFDFVALQRLALNKRGVFVSSHGSRSWAEAIANAAQAGASLDPANPPRGFEEVFAVINRRSAVI